jgi:hypothetical protein
MSSKEKTSGSSSSSSSGQHHKKRKTRLIPVADIVPFCAPVFVREWPALNVPRAAEHLTTRDKSLTVATWSGTLVYTQQSGISGGLAGGAGGGAADKSGSSSGEEESLKRKKHHPTAAAAATAAVDSQQQQWGSTISINATPRKKLFDGASYVGYAAGDALAAAAAGDSDGDGDGVGDGDGDSSMQQESTTSSNNQLQPQQQKSEVHVEVWLMDFAQPAEEPPSELGNGLPAQLLKELLVLRLPAPGFRSLSAAGHNSNHTHNNNSYSSGSGGGSRSDRDDEWRRGVIRSYDQADVLHLNLFTRQPQLVWSVKSAQPPVLLQDMHQVDERWKRAWLFQIVLLMDWFHSRDGQLMTNVIVPHMLASTAPGCRTTSTASSCSTARRR